MDKFLEVYLTNLAPLESLMEALVEIVALETLDALYITLNLLRERVILIDIVINKQRTILILI